MNATNVSEDIPSGNYSLVTLNEIIIQKMNDLFPADFEGEPNIRTNTIGIKSKSTITFSILTNDQCKLIGVDYTKSINNVLRNVSPNLANSSNGYIYQSGYVDLIPIRNLYIVSSGLGNFNAMSISGERSIIEKVPVNAGYGEMICDQSFAGIDYLDCSHQTLSRLSFQLKDVFGNNINLDGQHWYFSIVFSRISETM